ncbi:regulator of G-protein signaling 12 isoform X2 [Scleropages formosus]|uniref:regulator of G-protein signaling 12 isoform X2 n=1 Tax=Scleropages formosus TaxID=113540 RepID=UPI000878D20D|nr:regulator of G-protein signaling 12-like isoform X2 [Scleropages formosus]
MSLRTIRNRNCTPSLSTLSSFCSQLSQKACEIYNNFLSSRATTPVNIDRQAQLADDVLNAPRPDMFQEPQLQIFNLMKFDSYARFLRSSMYQECMLAEVEGHPLSSIHRASGSPEQPNLVTPRKEAKKVNPVKGKTQECKEEHAEKKRGIFSLRNRNTSFGKGPKKSDMGDSSHDVPSSNGRRESRGSLSSSASLELGSGSSAGRVEGDSRTPVATCEKEKVPASCAVSLPDGSRFHLPIRPGLSIRELLLGLCEKRCINLAAVDLFLAGGEKPLVLDQDCVTLSSRDLRLEKRTLFRLDLVPINRSVGLKAKPTKPITEVLRPVVAKYGLRLNDLEARISGDGELLDLGRPISCLDGLRVVLDVARHPSRRDLSARRAPPLMARSRSTAGDEKAVNVRGGNGSAAKLGEKSKQKKINIDEAEEFFELLSKAQSSRADDQRGLLSKQNLVLPDFLRLSSEPTPSPAAPACSTPTSRRNTLSASRQSQSLDSALLLSGRAPSSTARPVKSSSPPDEGGCAPFPTSLSPIRTVEEENVADLTLVGEGNMSSPNSTLLPPSPVSPPPRQEDVQHGSGVAQRGAERATTTHPQRALSPLPAWRAIDVDGVQLEEALGESSELNLSLEGLVAELRGYRGRTRVGVYAGSDLPSLLATSTEDGSASEHGCRPTFV